MKRISFAQGLGASATDSLHSFASSLAYKSVTAERQSEQRYISRRELRALFPVSDMTIWRWMADPEVAFPRQVKLGRGGRNFWWLPEIREWERRRATKSPIDEARGAESRSQSTLQGSAPTTHKPRESAKKRLGQETSPSGRVI
jgi:predicted DNA-binding transcriptional regulator AlpA